MTATKRPKHRKLPQEHGAVIAHEVSEGHWEALINISGVWYDEDGSHLTELGVQKFEAVEGSKWIFVNELFRMYQKKTERKPL